MVRRVRFSRVHFWSGHDQYWMGLYGTRWDQEVQGVFFTGPPLKKTKSKIVLEYPDWASPGLPKKVKVHGVGLPQYRRILKVLDWASPRIND